MARSTERCGTLPHSATTAFCSWLQSGWLSWIINIDRPSVEKHPEQHNQLNLSLGCLKATCQARSTLITQPVSGVAGLSASSDISRGSVATHLRCGGICSDSFITNCLLILTVKEFWKSVNIWWSYEVYKKLCHFFGPPCRLSSFDIELAWLVLLIVLLRFTVFFVNSFAAYGWKATTS